MNQAPNATALYQLKPGTTSSYYRIGGDSFLPRRLSIASPNTIVIADKGRNHIQKSVAQLRGTYTKGESKPGYSVTTQIWEIPDKPELGYGTIGEKQCPTCPTIDNGNIVILKKLPDNILQIDYYFASKMQVYEIANMNY